MPRGLCKGMKSSDCRVPFAITDWTCLAQVVGEWNGVWGACSLTCGSGVQSQSRPILVTASAGGVSCPALSKTQACNTNACPGDCTMSAWSAWSGCSTSCDDGAQSRSRSVVTPAQNGGYCSPTLAGSQQCFVTNCPASCQVRKLSQKLARDRSDLSIEIALSYGR